MKFHYAGKYSGDPEDLPHGEHVPGAVKFKEAKDSKTLGLIANAMALGLFGALGIASGAGDFINVYHAITQMPEGSMTYLYKFNSYWYLP